MLASGRTGIVCKIVLLVSLLVVVTTVTLIMHAIMSNRRSLLHRTSTRRDASFSKITQPIGGGGGGGGSSRSDHGLMALIANVTKTVIAMEMQATSLNDELKSMREKTRELLMQQRHTALWTVLHKCVFLYSCKDQNAKRGAPQTIAQDAPQRSTQESASAVSARSQSDRDKISGDGAGDAVASAPVSARSRSQRDKAPGDGTGDSVVSVQKIERKYSMYRLRRRS